ncbi:MAG: (4Fe-4S)-binding protein [Dysgonamonadaceae bacterium]|jgi:hypothetical protein|nr:(4Fe-4S)-binding protein [Dysgonamonadaceae bacterium]
MQQEVTRKDTNGTIPIVWRPAKCIHLKHCWQELPKVFSRSLKSQHLAVYQLNIDKKLV